MGEWKADFCGCFEDCGLCILAYFVPCYQAGKNAETVGKDCCLFGALYLFVPCISGAIVRTAVREEKGINGSFIGDILAHGCCPFCALVQEGREMQASPGAQTMVRA